MTSSNRRSYSRNVRRDTRYRRYVSRNTRNRAYVVSRSNLPRYSSNIRRVRRSQQRNNGIAAVTVNVLF